MSRTSALSRFQCYLRAFSHNEEGAAAVIVALLLTVLLAFVAFGTDIAVIYRDQSQLQAHSDLTALGVAADLDEADYRLDQMLDGNALTDDAVEEMILGRYLRNPAIPPELRFTEIDPNSTEDTPIINAVALRLNGEAPLTFGQLITDSETVPISATATAWHTGMMSFSLGSRLLSLEPGTLSDLLSVSLGAEVSLGDDAQTALDGEQININDFLTALARQVGNTSENPAAILSDFVSVGDIARALQEVSASSVRTQLNSLIHVDTTVLVADILGVEANTSELGLTAIDFYESATESALNLILAAADSVTPLPAPDVLLPSRPAPDVLLPSRNEAPLASVKLRLSLPEGDVESGWIELGDDEPLVLNSSFARLSAEVELSDSDRDGDGDGILTFSFLDATLPIYIELAGIEAELDEMNCIAHSLGDITASFSTSNRPLDLDNDIFSDSDAPVDSAIAALYLGELSADDFHAGDRVDLEELGFVDLLSISLLDEESDDGGLLGGIGDLLGGDDGISPTTVTVRVRSSFSVAEATTSEVNFTFEDADLLNQPGNTGVSRPIRTGNLLSTTLSQLLSPDMLEIEIVSGAGEVVAIDAVAGLLNTTVGTLSSGISSLLSGNEGVHAPLSEDWLRSLVLRDLGPLLVYPLDTIIDEVLADEDISLAQGELTLTGHHCERVQLVQ